MNSRIQQLKDLLCKHMNIPVFIASLPENESSPFIVVGEEIYDEKSKCGEYHVNVYYPNKLRVFGNLTDNTFPDIDNIERICERILDIYKDQEVNHTNKKVHIRKFIKHGAMHYANIHLQYHFQM